MAQLREWLRARGGERSAAMAFPVIGLAAFASLLLPPGPAHWGWFWAALAIAVANSTLVRALHWRRLPRWAPVLPLLGAVLSVGILIYAAGQTTGLTPLVLLPFLAAALYGEPRETVLVVPACAAMLVLVSRLNGESATVAARLLVFWPATLVVLGISLHGLRSRLTASTAAAVEDARQSRLMSDAARTLTVLQETHLVLRAAVRLAAEMASPRSSAGRRAQYSTLVGSTLVITADSDETSVSAAGEAVPLDEHPMARRAVESGRPVSGRIDPEEFGPAVRALMTRFGLNYGAWVPVHLDGRVHGLISATSRTDAIPESMLSRLVALANLTELALAGATAHERLQAEARTDPLTGLDNRREFTAAMLRLSRRDDYAMLAIDVDGLKQVNDRHGHAAGDALIRGVAGAMATVVRRGDTLARVGGDEFSILAIAADHEGGERLAQRVLDSVAAVRLKTGTPCVSIGVCVAAAATDPEEALREADAALYEAKRGSDRMVVRDVRVGAVAGKR